MIRVQGQKTGEQGEHTTQSDSLHTKEADEWPMERRRWVEEQLKNRNHACRVRVRVEHLNQKTDANFHLRSIQ